MSETSTTTIWRSRVAEWRESGVTANEFCRGKEFSVGSLRHWVWRLGRAPKIRIAKVTRTSPSRSLSIELGNGARISIDADDRAALVMIIEVLDTQRPR